LLVCVLLLLYNYTWFLHALILFFCYCLIFTYAFVCCSIAWFPSIVPVGFSSGWGSPPYMFLVSDAGTIKGYRVATISIDSQSSRRLCLCLPTDRSIILVVAIRVIFYAIAIALSFPYLSSLRASSRFGIWFGIRFTIWHTSQSRLPLFDTSPRTSYYDCLAMASLPFSLTRQEPLRSRTRVEYLLFDTRRVQTSKRSNLEAWIQETWNLHQ